MNKSLSVSSLFYDDKLFQIGDLVDGQGEYLDTSYGFTKYKTGGVITNILIEEDTLCNSLYLNHGITQSSIGGLGLKFELNGVKHYVFENKTLFIPASVKEQIAYFTAYYNHPSNIHRLESLLQFIKVEHNREITKKELNKLGYIVKTQYKELFRYFFVCLLIRNGTYGKINRDNFSSIVFSTLREQCGYESNVNNYIHKLTYDNIIRR